MKENQNPDAYSGGIEKRTYTVSEVQTMLNCSRQAVYELLQKQEFRCIRIGTGRGAYRISCESFDAWLNNQH